MKNIKLQKIKSLFIYDEDQKEQLAQALEWTHFLAQESFDSESVAEINLKHGPAVKDSDGNQIKIDFLGDQKNYHKKNLSASDPLIRAIKGAARASSIKGAASASDSRGRLRVLDMSAGLGRDAVFLAQAGFEVTAVERNPLLLLMLEAAHTAANTAAQKASISSNTATNTSSNASDLCWSRLRFVYGPALNFLSKAWSLFDVIYFDPMFPTKKKSALAKQDMRLFRNLVGDDLDAGEVLAAALSGPSENQPEGPGPSRVVVKRPIKAPPLEAVLKSTSSTKPSGSVSGKLVRFDIYSLLG